MTGRHDTWMPLFVADYLKDTRHLSGAEHGAYLLLLMHAWTNDGAIPDDDVRLARIACLTPKEWRAARDAVLAFWVYSDKGFRHKRVDQELARATANIEQRAAAGRASAEARKRQRTGNGRSTDVATDAQRNGRPSPSPLDSLTTFESSDTNVSGAEAPGLPLGDTPEQPRTDPDRHAWGEAVRLLTEQGAMTQAKARSFFGKLIRDNGLQAKDLLGSLATALANQTGDPQAYLTKAAQAVAKRKAPTLAIHPLTNLPIEPSWGG